MTYSIIWEEGGLRTVWTGRVTSREVLEFQRKIQGDRRFDDIAHSLHDFLGCAEVVFSEDDMFEVAAIDRAGAMSNARQIRIAVVTTDPSVAAMIQCYLAAGQSPYPLRFFAGIDEARAWIRQPR